MVILFLIFWGNSILFSMYLHHFTFPPTPWSEVPISPHPCLFFSFFLYFFSKWVGMRWYLIVTCISMIIYMPISDLEYFFICFWQFVYLWEIPSQVLCSFKKSGCLFCCCCVRVPFYILWLSNIWFANISSHLQTAFSPCWLFPLLCRSFSVWCTSICIFFGFAAYAFAVIFKK